MRNDLLSMGISLAVCIPLGFVLIPLLRALKFGQSILEIGPAWHMSKQGTPTMGGVMFIVSVVVATLITGGFSDGAHLLLLGFSIACALIGLADDLLKIKRKKNGGLSETQKMALLIAVSAAFLAALMSFGYLHNDVYIPFLKLRFEIPVFVFAVLSLLAICAAINAVNFTDGLDGLCGGVTIPVAIFFSILAHERGLPGLSAVGFAVAGGLAGFLVFNFYPAKVFMGDTGSLFLGAMSCGLAFAVDMPLIFAVVGLVYVIEMLSVVLQRGFFKLTKKLSSDHKGRRIFKMAPIHHHFEKSGWSELKIFSVFVGVTVLLCVASYFLM